MEPQAKQHLICSLVQALRGGGGGSLGRSTRGILTSPKKALIDAPPQQMPTLTQEATQARHTAAK